jgi:hypothetical protein
MARRPPDKNGNQDVDRGCQKQEAALERPLPAGKLKVFNLVKWELTVNSLNCKPVKIPSKSHRTILAKPRIFPDCDSAEGGQFAAIDVNYRELSTSQSLRKQPCLTDQPI